MYITFYYQIKTIVIILHSTCTYSDMSRISFFISFFLLGLLSFYYYVFINIIFKKEVIIIYISEYLN